MSDADLLALYIEYVQILVTYVGMIITILFAYLGANYLAAKSFSWLQFTLLAGMFLIISSDLANNVRVHEIRLTTIETELKIRIEESESSISYISTIGLGESSPLLVFSFWIVVSFISVFFAIQVKRGNGNGNGD